MFDHRIVPRDELLRQLARFARGHLTPETTIDIHVTPNAESLPARSRRSTSERRHSSHRGRATPIPDNTANVTT